MNTEVQVVKSQTLMQWAQENSIWTHDVSLSCCAMEFMAVTGPRYDWERFGALVQENVKNADLLIISGPIVSSYVPRLRQLYRQMRSPKFVISMGSCANSGGIFRGRSDTVIASVDKILPVDIYLPGCPPRPEALLHALLRLQNAINGRTDTKRPESDG